jgi:hypothetical protein
MSIASMNDAVRHSLDAGAIGIAALALFDMLPKIAALLSIVWLCVQLYDRFRHGPKARRE